MLHATGGPGLASKSLLRRLIAHKSLAQDLERDRAVNQQMRSAINGAHAAAAEPLVEAVFPFEHTALERV
jgi:hypothetical protein